MFFVEHIYKNNKQRKRNLKVYKRNREIIEKEDLKYMKKIYEIIENKKVGDGRKLYEKKKKKGK